MSAWKSAEAVVGRNFLATLRGDDGTTASSPEKLQAAAGQASHRLLQGARRVTLSNDWGAQCDPPRMAAVLQVGQPQGRIRGARHTHPTPSS